MQFGAALQDGMYIGSFRSGPCYVGQSLQCLIANFGQSILQLGKISAGPGANIVEKQPRNFVDTCSV